MQVSCALAFVNAMFMSKVFFTYLTLVGLYSSAYAAVQRSPGQNGRGSLRCEQEDEIQKAVIARSAQVEGNHLNLNDTTLQQKNTMLLSIAPHLSPSNISDKAVSESNILSSKTGTGLKGAMKTTFIQAQPTDQEKAHNSSKTDRKPEEKKDGKPEEKKSADGDAKKPAAGGDKCADKPGTYWSEAQNDCLKGCDANSKSPQPNANGNCECKEEHMCYEKHLEEEIKVLIKEMSKDAQNKIEEIVKSETANSPPTPGCPMNEDGSTKSNPHVATSKVFYEAGCAHCHCVKNGAPRAMVITTLFFTACALLGSGLL